MTVTRIGPPEAEMLLLAVADGVGSALKSHVGHPLAPGSA
ncbi:hypothetical protein ABZ865_07840 [Streptomyces sp. NPDC047085]